MKLMKLVIFILCFVMIGYAYSQEGKKYVMVVHGGAGTIPNMTEEGQKKYRDALQKALLAGYAQINSGKSSLDAVEAAIKVLEDCPLFNAGKGAVFTNEGKNELDAAIMNGKTLAAGSVASVSVIKNPISAARAVMEKSEHVMMVGKGAEKFAKKAGVEIVSTDYFFTKERWESLQKVLKEKKADESAMLLDGPLGTKANIDNKFGTVGAVALDKNGNLAAGTSTGGMTNKKFGRVGDAPIIGAGTYANHLVGMSCTGWGEYFIRSVASKEVASLVEYKNYSIQEASQQIIKQIERLGGDGGMIVLDKYGNMCQTFNTAGMYRGAITDDGKIEINIYK